MAKVKHNLPSILQIISGKDYHSLVPLRCNLELARELGIDRDHLYDFCNYFHENVSVGSLRSMQLSIEKFVKTAAYFQAACCIDTRGAVPCPSSLQLNVEMYKEIFLSSEDNFIVYTSDQIFGDDAWDALFCGGVYESLMRQDKKRVDLYKDILACKDYLDICRDEVTSDSDCKEYIIKDFFDECLFKEISGKESVLKGIYSDHSGNEDAVLREVARRTGIYSNEGIDLGSDDDLELLDIREEKGYGALPFYDRIANEFPKYFSRYLKRGCEAYYGTRKVSNVRMAVRDIAEKIGGKGYRDQLNGGKSAGVVLKELYSQYGVEWCWNIILRHCLNVDFATEKFGNSYNKN